MKIIKIHTAPFCDVEYKGKIYEAVPLIVGPRGWQIPMYAVLDIISSIE